MSVSLSLNGRIFGADHSLARKQPFHLYDEKNRFLMLAKTNGEGAFKVTLPAPSDADEKMKLIFRLCTEDKWIKSHPALSGDPRLAENLSFLRGKQEVAELEETVLVKPEEQELGDLHLSVPIESEKVPLKYLLDLAAASIPANLSAAIAKTKERFDVFNLHGVDDVLEAFSPVKSELTPENTWKLITNGICPLYLKNEDPFLIAEVNWDRYEFDQLESLPNIKMVFKKKGDHLPEFERLEVTFRKTLEPSSLESNKMPKRIFKPDSDDLKTGLRIANSVFHVYGQTVFHLGMGHV